MSVVTESQRVEDLSKVRVSRVRAGSFVSWKRVEGEREGGDPIPNSSMLVFPTMSPPADLIFLTTVASNGEV